MKILPKHIERLQKIRDVDTHNLGEWLALAMLVVMWVNDAGKAWPSLETWAKWTKMDTRVLRRIVRRLEKNGVLEVVKKAKGGQGVTTVYRVSALASNPDAESGLKIGRRMSATGTPRAGFPDSRFPEPGRAVPQSVQKNNQENNHEPVVVDLFSRLGLEELRDHPNATPARVAYIESRLATAKDPRAFAAAAFRDGYNAPPVQADPAAAKKAERERRLKDFESLPEDQRHDIERRARAKYPNMANDRGYPVTHPGMQGAIAEVMADLDKRKCA